MSDSVWRPRRCQSKSHHKRDGFLIFLIDDGFLSYFGIPSSFVEASIKQNILYFFNLFQLVFAIVGQMKWQVLAAAAFATIIIVLMSWYNSRCKLVFTICGLAVLAFLLWGSYNFGGFIASSMNEFFALSDGCTFNNTSTAYVVSYFYDTKAIFIPYETNTNKILPGFIVKEVTDIPCLLQRKNIGVLKK